MCPFCDGKSAVDMGTLGAVHWVRCRDCGMDYMVDDEEED